MNFRGWFGKKKLTLNEYLDKMRAEVPEMDVVLDTPFLPKGTQVRAGNRLYLGLYESNSIRGELLLKPGRWRTRKFWERIDKPVVSSALTR